MKIVIDENIAFAEEAFSEFGETVLLPGRSINNDILKNADVLIVRSVTNINEKLLNGTAVKFTGTATIGKDHIDIDYLKNRNIEFADASGCNADAVAEYVFAALTEITAERKLSFKNLTIGVVGVGNIGSRVVKYAQALGMKVIKNDPPLKRLKGDPSFKEIDDVFKADIITLHVPLNLEGEDKTYHFFNNENLNKVMSNSIFINTSRGSVVDNSALEKLIPDKNIVAVIDVWENEPAVNLNLLDKVFIASPHVAGYSFEGKVNGTKMIYSALCRFLNTKEKWTPVLPAVSNNEIVINEHKSIEETLRYIFRNIYDIRKDTERMKEMNGKEKSAASEYFDLLRKNYPLRREFSNYTIVIPKKFGDLEQILSTFRFKIKTT